MDAYDQSLMSTFRTLIRLQKYAVMFLREFELEVPSWRAQLTWDQARKSPLFSKFPVLFPVSRETRWRDWFAADCFLRQWLGDNSLCRPARTQRRPTTAGIGAVSSALRHVGDGLELSLLAGLSPNLRTRAIWCGSAKQLI